MDNAKQMLSTDSSLEPIAARVENENINPETKSGRQELLESIVNQFV